jgi:hypothetical protein
MFDKMITFLRLGIPVQIILLSSSLSTANDTIPSAYDWGNFADRSTHYHNIETLHRHNERTDSTHAYDAIAYNLDIQLFHESQLINGFLEMEFVSLVDGLEIVELHLAALDFSNVMFNGTSVNANRINDLITVDISGMPMGLNENATLSLQYAGTPWTGNNLGLFFTQNVAYTLSDPWGTRNWVPCYDEPFDKALWSINVRAASTHKSLSNGQLISTVDHDDGTSTWSYHHSHPVSTYLVSICSGNYSLIDFEWNGIDMVWMVYPNHQNIAQTAYSRVDQMFDCFTELWGEYPFETYAMGEAEVYTGFGGMEHQTCSTIGDGLVAAGLTYESVFAHELSHQWWGDALTPVDFRHVWLNEGWATYAEAFYFSHLNGGSWISFLEYMEEIHATYLSWDNEFLPIYDPPLSNLFNISQYEKSASVLHMLRLVVGEDVFFDAQRLWYQTYRDGTVDTEDYKNLMESESGLDLNWFFEQWIYSGGYPTYSIVKDHIDNNNGCIVSLSVTQDHQILDSFQMRVPVRISTSEVVFDTLLNVDQHFEHFVFELAGTFSELNFNSDNWVLCDIVENNPSEFLDLELLSWEIEDSFSGDGDGNLSPGENGGLELEIINHGAWDLDLEFEIFSLSPDVSITGAWSTVTQIASGESIILSADEVSLLATDNLELGWLEFNLSYSSHRFGAGNLPIRIVGGHPQIIVVNDDLNANYSEYYLSALDSLSAFANLFSIADTELSEIPLDFEFLIWYTGDSGSSLSLEELNWINEFLENASGCIISGQDAFDTLNPQDLQNHLSISSVDAASAQVLISGTPASPMEGISALLIGASGAGNQTTPSSIQPTADAQTILQYQSGQIAGISLNTVNDKHLVLLSFGLESISGLGGTDSREVFLDHLLSLVNPDWTAIDNENFSVAERPNAFRLKSIAPNPFNPQAVVEFELAGSGKVYFEIFNLLGKRIETIPARLYPAGQNNIVLNAEGLASGIYFLTMNVANIPNENANFNSMKFIVLK